MKGKILALATAVTICMTALTATSPAEARWRGGGWGGGWGPGTAAGIVGAAVIGGIASSAYVSRLRLLWRLPVPILRRLRACLLRRLRSSGTSMVAMVTPPRR